MLVPRSTALLLIREAHMPDESASDRVNDPLVTVPEVKGRDGLDPRVVWIAKGSWTCKIGSRWDVLRRKRTGEGLRIRGSRAASDPECMQGRSLERGQRYQLRGNTRFY